MRNLIFVFILAVLLAPVAASASQVEVDGKNVMIADSFARVENWFGQPALEVHFFARPLTDEQKAAIAAIRYPSAEKIKAIAPGNYSVLQLYFFFEKGTESCAPEKFLSYTAVFEKGPDLLTDSIQKGPINWAFAKPKEMSKVGVAQLDCSFTQGSPVHLKVKHQWVAEGDYAAKLYAGRREPVLFTWDVETQTNVIIPSR